MGGGDGRAGSCKQRFRKQAEGIRVTYPALNKRPILVQQSIAMTGQWSRERQYSVQDTAEAALCNAEAAMCYFSTLIIAVLYISALCTAHIIVVRHQYKVHLKAIRYED